MSIALCVTQMLNTDAEIVKFSLQACMMFGSDSEQEFALATNEPHRYEFLSNANV